MRRIGGDRVQTGAGRQLVRAKATMFVSHHHADNIGPRPCHALQWRAVFGMLVLDDGTRYQLFGATKDAPLTSDLRVSF